VCYVIEVPAGFSYALFVRNIDQNMFFISCYTLKTKEKEVLKLYLNFIFQDADRPKARDSIPSGSNVADTMPNSVTALKLVL